ncbi:MULTISPECIES: hypothetical protein [Brevundimonas]|uniref:hypothetical protein n=1 Tax=Brevundimonas TaxID=41275 RepID=UPI000AA84978|nr:MULTISPECIES: hypothetical protein [Brevundimonas]
MTKGKKDKDQFELDLNVALVLDNVTAITCHGVRTSKPPAAVHDIGNSLVVAQAVARKERAERVLRSVGLMA